jgi:MATE family multidrug resistance protein
MNDVRTPMLLGALSYWAIGFSLAYALGFSAGMGAVGIWVGLSVGLGCAALLLSLRFRRLSRRGYLPGVSRA